MYKEYYDDKYGPNFAFCIYYAVELKDMTLRSFCRFLLLDGQ